ncbi:MAG: hypothetical protein V1865_02580 [bacterium]
MIITSQGLSKREKLLILALVIILIFSAYSWYEMRNTDSKYERNAIYCKADYDCAVVYDLINDECLTVNGLHKHEYEQDVTCRNKNAVCIKDECVLK